MRLAEAGASFGNGGSSFRSGILGGLSQVSFWLMKKRARSIGEGGAHDFVTQLMRAAGDAEIHLVGHSFGCVVVSSILGGPNARGTLPRPVSSAVLLQGAVSLWSWSERVRDLDTPGYFHPVIVNGAVRGPVVTTRSRHDKAVGLAYPAAVALAGQAAFGVNDVELPLFGGTGSFGLQGTSIAESQPMQNSTGEYRFQPGRIYNLECSDFIDSHSGIDNDAVAHAIWQSAWTR